MYYYVLQKDVLKSRNKDLIEFFEYGVGVHHAGMLRAHRGLTERLFSDGLLKVKFFLFQMPTLCFLFCFYCC